jgi:CDP-diacylglycerol--glycerol-3-phosphate 3-phosphatidyltransferase
MDSWQAKLTALGIFILASITDFFDGYLARKLNKHTRFGNFMDPLADKLFVGAALIALPYIEENLFPMWMVFLILAREFIVTYLRIYAISKSQDVKTLRLGKTKTTLQLVTIVVIIGLLVYKAFIPNPPQRNLNLSLFEVFKNYFINWDTFVLYTPIIFMSITTLITVYSGVLYIYKNKHLFFNKESA